jgi:hypothetical protein
LTELQIELPPNAVIRDNKLFISISEEVNIFPIKVTGTKCGEVKEVLLRVHDRPNRIKVFCQ